MGDKSTDSSKDLSPNRWVNPKLGVKMPKRSASVGVGRSFTSVGVAPSFTSLGSQRRARRLRENPSPISDPYWARGGLQPFTINDLSDDEGDLSYLGDGHLGRPEVKWRFGNLRCPPAAMKVLSSGSAGDVGKRIDACVSLRPPLKQIGADEVKPQLKQSVVKPFLKLSVKRPAPDEPDSEIRALGTQYSFPIDNLELWEKLGAEVDREVDEMIRNGELCSDL